MAKQPTSRTESLVIAAVIFALVAIVTALIGNNLDNSAGFVLVTLSWVSVGAIPLSIIAALAVREVNKS